MKLFNLPNLLTLLNLFAGCIGIIFIFNYHIEMVPYCVLVSLIADFLDGFAARLTKTSSDIGRELDSLADVISFGLLPGAVMFQLLFEKYEASDVYYSATKMYILASPAFLITLCAALRLAKFNIDTRQTNSFLGLATPAATIFVIGFLLVFLNNTYGLNAYIFDRKVLYGIVLVLSVLMLVEIPMFAFKFKSFKWKGNEVVFLFIILSVVLLAWLKFAAISLIIILYVLVSIATSFIQKSKAENGD